VNVTAFDEAIAFAAAHETAWPRDPAADPARWGVHHADPPPYNRLRGPVHARGGVAGAVWQRGREVCAWGDADRADLCFSVAKTALAIVAGVAHARGLLPDVDERVGVRVRGIVESQAPLRTQHAPDHPLADQDGYIHMPNVNVVEELVGMIQTQRAYELNSKAIKTSDEMLQRLSQL